MAVLAAVKSALSGAGRWVVIGLLVLAAIAIPGFGWYRARKKLREAEAERDAALARADTEKKRAQAEAEVAETQRRISERLAAEKHRTAEAARKVRADRDEEKERIRNLDGDGIVSDWNRTFGDSDR